MREMASCKLLDDFGRCQAHADAQAVRTEEPSREHLRTWRVTQGSRQEALECPPIPDPV